MTPSPSSAPARILIVEDEMTIAMMLEDMLAELGHHAIAVAARLPQAMELATSCDIDLAILDVNLAGQPSFPVAAALRERHIPFVFATGYGVAGIDPDFADERVLNKPFLMAELGEAVARLR